MGALVVGLFVVSLTTAAVLVVIYKRVQNKQRHVDAVQ